MNEDDYEYLKVLWIYFIGIAVGLIISILAILMFAPSYSATMIYVNATDNLGNNYTLNFDLPNQTIIYNNSYNYSYITNQTFIYNYTIQNSTQGNITLINVTCINCTYWYNVTNITYVNQTNISQFYNGSQFIPGDYYNKGDIDNKYNVLNQKFDSYLLKSDNNSTLSATSYRAGTDTYLIIGIIISIIIGIFAIIIAIKGGFG